MSDNNVNPTNSWGDTRLGKPRVGDIARRDYTLTMADTEAWAAISQDYNPLHFDDTAAGKSIFGQRVGHGGIMQAILHGIIGTDLPGPGTVLMGVEWKFTNPILFDQTVTGTVEVLQVREDKPIARLSTSVARADGTVCLSGICVTYTSGLD